jgi:hypothetical protein
MGLNVGERPPGSQTARCWRRKRGGKAVWVGGGREAAEIVVPLWDGQVYRGMERLLRATSAALQGGHTHVLSVADSQAAMPRYYPRRPVRVSIGLLSITKPSTPGFPSALLLHPQLRT